MPITRAQLETILIGPDLLSGRLGRRMVMVKLYDPLATSPPTLGSVPALADPIAEALRSLGVTASSPINPDDTDLGQVADSNLTFLIAVAELKCLEKILGNIDEVDAQDGSDRQDWTKFAEHLLKAIDSLRKWLKETYGYGTQKRMPRVGVLTTGNSWPHVPPPPSSLGPYPQTPDPIKRRRFNP